MTNSGKVSELSQEQPILWSLYKSDINRFLLVFLPHIGHINCTFSL